MYVLYLLAPVSVLLKYKYMIVRLTQTSLRRHKTHIHDDVRRYSFDTIEYDEINRLCHSKQT